MSFQIVTTLLGLIIGVVVRWLKPKALIGIHRISKVETHRAWLVVGWVTFLALDVCYTLPLVVHQSYWRYPSKLESFNQLCWECRCLPLAKLIRVTSHMRLKARDHYTSSTLIGGKGRACSSAWGTNIVCGCKMDVKSTWIPTWHRMDRVSWSLDYFQKPPLGGRPHTKPRDYGTSNVANHWFIVFYHVWGSS